jgi:hypothetical protein
MAITITNATLTNVKLAPFSPLTLNPDIWLDASDITTITKDGADKVSQWDDKSGNGNNATQGTGSQQGIFTPSAINSLSAINFDGVDDKMATALNWSLQWHIFIVIRPTAVTGVRTILSSYDGTGGLNFNGQYIFDVRSGSAFLFQAANLSPPLSGAPSGGVNPNENYLLELTSDASKFAELFINDEFIDDGTHGTTGATEPTYVAGNIVTNTNTFKGFYGLFLKFPTILASGDRTTLLTYFANKWGV